MNEPTSSAKVQISKNGPYVVSGNLPLSKETIGANQNGESVQWERGAGYPRQEQYALCRRGHRANKPFCDGTHKKIGFDGTETASRRPYLEQATVMQGPVLSLTDSDLGTLRLQGSQPQRASITIIGIRKYGTMPFLSSTIS